MSVWKDSKNPFDDERDADDEDDDGFVGHGIIDDYDPALDPFADDGKVLPADHHDQLVGNKSNEEHFLAMSNKTDVYHCSTPIWSCSTGPVGNLDDCSSINSMSRLSLASNNSNLIAEQQLKQYSLGDGSLEKEGLLCPECMLQCKTITELMNHFDGQHKSTKSSKSMLNMSTMSKQLLPANQTSFPVAQVGGQIKGFLNKYLVSPANKQLRATTTSANDSDSDLNRSDSYETSTSQSWCLQQNFSNPISQWKNSMSQGAQRSHYEQFRTIRESRIERYVFETNKLLIRLDKLLRDYPPLADMVARRKHEQSVVDWVDESVVTLCPSCASKFNILTRKRHHCRLCGAVMCSKCCYFITFEFAYQLINPIAMNQSLKSTPSTKNVDSANQENHSFPLKSFLTKRIHMNRLGMVDQENVDKLRVCGDCKSLLVVRKEKIDVAHFKAPVVQLYEQLRDLMHQMDRLLPVYFRMANSIGMGESTYQLDNAHQLKHKLTKLGEEADVISRKIESCGVMDMESQVNDATQECSNVNGPCARQLSIQASIRRATVHYLRQRLLGLPELPDEQSFQELKQKHAEFIEKRIQMDKQMASLERERFETSRMVVVSDDQHDNQSNIIIGDSEDAFCPQITFSGSNNNLWSNMNDEERAAILQEEDPILQQINIIRSYIRQANNDHRYEEEAMLKHNLQQLNIEYYFAQQQKKANNNTNPFDEDDDDVDVDD